ncbi:hypothetical protein N7454_006512 [Penicillium verhagenii]|nr:hypothetical protein N7454_006512 [Penicillium verhagenii]
MAVSHPESEIMPPPDDRPYRIPVELPFELIQHVGIFFEEEMCPNPPHSTLGRNPANNFPTDDQGLNLLYNTLSSGTYAAQKVFSPLPQHVALAVTFLVHPSTTTSAKSDQLEDPAFLALRLLRLLSTLVSPQDCGLNHAFKFSHQALRSGRQHRTLEEEGDLQSPGHGLSNVRLALEESLWSRAEDFWHAVGWAFNCSVLHPERWERWQIWLQYMCDIMEDDWAHWLKTYEEIQARRKDEAQKPEEVSEEKATPKKARNAASDANQAGSSKDSKTGHAWKNVARQVKSDQRAAKKTDQDRDIFRESLIFKFINASTDTGRNRRILRAIFADGSTFSVNEFRKVFKTELKAPPTPDQVKKRDREVNIDKDQYGDYMTPEMDEDDDEDLTPGPARRSKRTRRGTRTGAAAQPDAAAQTSIPQHSAGLAPMGGISSLRLRKRLFGILSDVANQLPREFIDWFDLYTLFADLISVQPLPIFQALVSPTILPEFSNEEQSTLCEMMLLGLREASAPSLESEGYLSQAKLELCFLPFAAATNSVANNTKMSILLEAAIMLLGDGGFLTATPSFRKAVEDGINRRSEQTQDGLMSSKNSRNMDPLEFSWLLESHERLTSLTELLPTQALN